jgi:tetratricopeptide (TPR) repeat protein
MRRAALVWSLCFGLAGVAAAQAPSQPANLDPANIRKLEQRVRIDIAAQIVSCEFIIPELAADKQPTSRKDTRLYAEFAQACWNASPTPLVAFALARFLERLGDTAGADAAIAAAETKYGQTGPILAGKAGRLARAGDAAGATALIDQAIAAGPQGSARDPDNWVKLDRTILAAEADMLDLRLKVLNAAVDRSMQRSDKDERVRTLLNRARLLFEAKRYEDVRTEMDNAMPFTGKDDRDSVLYLRARALRALGQLEPAKADFAAAVQADPAIASAESSQRLIALAKAAPPECRTAMRGALGLFVSIADDLDSAVTAAEACSAAGRPAVGLTFQAVLRNKTGERSTALGLLEKAIAAEPGFAHAYYVRAQALIGAERAADAINALDKAIELDGADGRFYFERAKALIALGERAKARADQERGLARDPQERDQIGAYVSNLIALGDYQCALAVLDGLPRDLAEGDAGYANRAEAARKLRGVPEDQRVCQSLPRYGADMPF